MNAELRLSTLLALVVGMALATAAFYEPLPPWMPVPLVLLAAWRLWPAWEGRPCPMLPQTYKVATLLGLSALLWMGGRLGLGIEGAGALFIVLLWSKLLELHELRDLHATCAIALFVVAAQLLVSQSLAQCLLALLSSLLLLAVLVQVYLVGLRPSGGAALARPWQDWWRAQRIVGAIALQGAPFALLLFICVPRPPIGPQLDTRSTRSGFLDHLEPGSVAELALDQAPAFRVSFLDGGHPPTSECYWRGLVLWQTDGANWKRSPGYASEPADPNAQVPDATRPEVSYEVTMLPTNMKWVFTLDCPIAVESESSSGPNYVRRIGQVWEDRNIVSSTRVYRGRSQLLPADDLPYARTMKDAFWRPNYRALPVDDRHQLDLDPRIIALADRIKAKAPDPEHAVEALLRWYQEQNFVYTLHPGSMGTRPTATFLFEKRRGFCEHYASATTILLRAMGFPARVVLGYCGGEWNSIGNFMTVRQSNAHAWCEVYVDGTGWERVDPCSVVQVQDDEGNLLPNDAATDARALTPSRVDWLSKRMTWLSQRWDYIEAKWDHWALTYDQDSLYALQNLLGLGKLGLAGPLLLLVGLGVPTLLLLLLVLRLRRYRGDPLQALYRRLCDRLAGAGVARHPDEGPITFARRAGFTFPEQAATILAAAALYAELRYGPPPGPERLPERLARLRGLVAQVRPGQHAPARSASDGDPAALVRSAP